MQPGTYLLRLTARLSDGLARLPASWRERHVAYLRAAQNRDGGFSGREGDSDLYYTGFALRGLAVLGALDRDTARRAADFLRQRLGGQASVIDFFSLLYSCVLVQLAGGPNVFADSPTDWPERVAATLENLRTAEGGYAKAPGQDVASTYHTFLVGLCYEVLGRNLPRPDEVLRFIDSRRREDGGFVEIAPMRKSGTNPTAAAIGVLQLLQTEPTLEVRDGVIGLLAEAPSVEGGLRANARIPVADLLSTFTGLWTLHELGALDRIDVIAARQYAEALAVSSGGFHAGLWDKQTDVEYTFYGLGVLGLLAR